MMKGVKKAWCRASNLVSGSQVWRIRHIQLTRRKLKSQLDAVEIGLATESLPSRTCGLSFNVPVPKAA